MPSMRYPMTSTPGVRRDGTPTDSTFYQDGVWVRWQRGKPRKMGGYRAMSRLANGPVRAAYADARNDVNSAHFFSPWGVQRQQFDANGAGGDLEDRTPVGFTKNDALTWSVTSMYSATGSPYTAIIACATPDINDIAGTTQGSIYYGDISTNDALVQITSASVPITTSGGICVLQPYLFVYGENGQIRNSNANDFSDSTGWVNGGGEDDANTANVAATKFVYGAPMRGGGQSPSGLFWALDSLVRVSFTGDSRIWQYDTLTQPTSILSKKCVVELDGKFFWVGTDRFFFYNGIVQELPNNMNQNWFFDNLNFACRNKVWGTKNTRWGEIWWFYPRGSDTECNDAVIYNYRENTWYDAVLTRSAGDAVQTFQWPIWVGSEDAQQTKLLPIGLVLTTNADTPPANETLHFASTTGLVDAMMAVQGLPAGNVTDPVVLSHTPTTATMIGLITDIPSGTEITFSSMSSTTLFVEGSSITGALSGATGIVARVSWLGLNVATVSGTFLNGETVTGINGATAVIAGAPVDQQLDTVYQHEVGNDKVLGSAVTAIPSSFTSSNFGIAIGDPWNDVSKAPAMNTLVRRFEPDFNQSGELVVTLKGRSFPNVEETTLEQKTIAEDTPYVDFNKEERILTLTVESNVAGGFYEQGQVWVEMEPGSERPTVST
jgi:hypothetical protein